MEKMWEALHQLFQALALVITANYKLISTVYKQEPYSVQTLCQEIVTFSY